MKQILATEAVANEINAMRDNEFEEYSTAKELIADSFTSLIELVQHGRDADSDITPHTDDILRVMYAIGRYNSMINTLHRPSDEEAPAFVLNSNA